jgi:LPPG:FO 2-phospho-L-lactate transferase
VILGVSPTHRRCSALCHDDDMRIVFLTDGEGSDLAHCLAALLTEDDTLDVVVPVTRDHWTHGLKCCPDVDAFLTSPLDDIEAPTFAVADELAAVGFSPSWVHPSDAEIARQIQRTELLQAGYTLGAATIAMAARASLPFGLLPASDDRAELHVVVDEPDGRRAVHIAEYLADPQAHRAIEATVVTTSWEVSAAVREVVGDADVILIGPSSPILDVDPLLSTPGLRDAVAAPQLEVGHDAAAVLDAAREAVGVAR